MNGLYVHQKRDYPGWAQPNRVNPFKEGHVPSLKSETPHSRVSLLLAMKKVTVSSTGNVLRQPSKETLKLTLPQSGL